VALLEVELRLGDPGEGPKSFVDPRGLAVDSLGRIFVMERAAPEIRIYGPDGTPIQQSGRKGEGPGEFIDPVGLAFDRTGSLWVVDQGLSRVSQFDHEARFLRTVTRSFSGSSVGWWRGVIDDRGRLVDVLERPGELQSTTLLRAPLAATSQQDTAILPPYKVPAFELARKNSWTRASVPFTPRFLWALDRHGNVWSGVSDQYQLVKRSFSGDTLARLAHEYEAPAVTSSEREEAIQGLEWFVKQGGRIDASRIPSRKPLFSALFTDDEERLWVQLNAPVAPDVAVFDVFSASGTFLGRVGGPLGTVVYPPVVVRGRLYAVVADTAGVPQIVRARVPPLKPPDPSAKTSWRPQPNLPERSTVPG
jgi:hypothetical protein